MKKILIMAAAILFAAGVNAQDSETDRRDKVYAGFKVGLNYSNVYDEQGQDFEAEAKVGLAAGAFLAIPLGHYLGFHPEVMFSQRGFKSTGTLFGTTYSLSRTTSYIDVPLLFAFKPSEFFSIVLGPQYSYLVQQNDVFTNGTTTIDQQKEFENDDLRKNMLCFTGGADINIKHLVIGARIGWDLQKNHGDGNSTTPRYKNTWLQGTVGYRF